MATPTPQPQSPGDILAAVRKAEAARDADHKARYARLVLDTASGVADGGRAAAELAALGIPPDVFAAAVGRTVNRQRLIGRMRAGLEAERDLPAVRQQVEAAEAERDRLVREFERASLDPLQADADRLREAQSDGTDARRELRKDAPPELVARAEELARQHARELAIAEQKRVAIDSWRRAADRGDQSAQRYVEQYTRDLTAAEARAGELAREALAAEVALLEAMPEPPAGADRPAAEIRPHGQWLPLGPWFS